MPARLRIALLVAIILPVIGLIAAIILSWGHGFRWLDLGLLIGMYVITAMGIGIGYHRLHTHRSFETVGVIRFLVTVFGSMAVQGPVLNWVATHRRHHHHSDDHQDPHSPHAFGSGFLAVIRGWWHSHMGWFFKPDAFNINWYVRDLQNDRMLRFVNATFLCWVALGLIIPAAIGGAFSGSWTGALLGFLWGGLVRMLLVHHVTWSINSVCHLWGSRPYHSDDHSRNNPIFGILAFGEGWHNNHHAFPTSARHGLAWWQVDMNYLVIRGLQMLGLAWKVRVPATQAVMAKRIRSRRGDAIRRDGLDR